MRSWANFNVNVIFVITTGGKTIPIWIISSEFIKFWILNKSRSGILNKKKCSRVVAGVPADFESRHQKLSIDAKILLEDHLWRFRVLLALYDQTIGSCVQHPRENTPKLRVFLWLCHYLLHFLQGISGGQSWDIFRLLFVFS